VRDRLAGLQDQQVITGHERVRRAGHGLDRQCLAALVGSQRVAGEHLQPAVALAGPQADPGAGAAIAGQVRPGAAFAIALQAGQRVIKPGRADRARLPEVILRALDRGRRAGRDAPVVRGQPRRRRQAELALVNGGGPDGQVRVRAGAVGGRAGAAVARGDGDMQATVRVQAVAGLDFQAERISLIAMRSATQQHRTGVVADQRPRRPAGQAVDRVAAGGFAEGQLEVGAVEGVPSAVDAVRPGGEELARAGRGQLVGIVAEDHRLVAEQQFAQSGAQLGDGGPVRPRLDAVLLPG
jgi:hypothetical protein